MKPNALLIGNSDGIGLATTRRLLAVGWDVIGISRSESPIKGGKYQHHVADVSTDAYLKLLETISKDQSFDLCIYFVGIGELLDLSDMSNEHQVVAVNLTGMVSTVACVIPKMVENRKGHFIGISSLADELLSAQAPSYHASKAGFTNYLNSLALAVKSKDVHITNLRFGFVNTKMVKGDVKPFMMTVEKAVGHVEYCIRKKPANYTAPKIAIPLVKFRKLMMRLGAK